MFQITKKEPLFFRKAKNKVKLPKVKGAWEDTNISAIRKKLRGDILLEEQNSLCAYCEREIDDDRLNSNIDHFKTRNLFPEETLNYNNLLVSCNSRGKCCSSSKDSQKSILKVREDYKNIVNPCIDNPEDYFDYLLTGEIVSKTDCVKSNFTIDVFKLGKTAGESLAQQRKKIADTLVKIDNLESGIDDLFKLLEDKTNVIDNIIDFSNIDAEVKVYITSTNLYLKEILQLVNQ